MENFGRNTLSNAILRELLPKDVFNSFIEILRYGKKLDRQTANAIAHAMKEWALSKGATHYTHWFQPMTGLTAEKHDAFLTLEADGQSLMRFSGTQLIRSEPDASSFPSGGMRTTFEARGYTAWDPRSPAFVMEGPKAKIFCIPSVFLSYHGDALDIKTPLLRSMTALDSSARRLLDAMGSPLVNRKITAFIGAEQEYFLIDKTLYDRRLDLKLSGRTLFGASTPKGQEMEDHYFGSISQRVLDFMQEAETELFALGVPCKTRHNEVAPRQYEIAPIHEEADIAADHNQLIMEVLKKHAIRKGFALLLHEKPFANLNGSGKHCNWSICTEDGLNLLSPGKTLEEHIHFLVFVLAFVKGVLDHGALLRASVASAGNDLRLGGNEAPPAIMSVFLGKAITDALDIIEKGGSGSAMTKSELDLGLSHLPSIVKDNTDRNRTSPIAFTGNKFEFRAVGASESIGFPVTVLNAIMVYGMDFVTSRLKALSTEGKTREEAVTVLLNELALETKAVRFDGNSYDTSWTSEAVTRGLPVLRKTPEAAQVLFDDNQAGLLVEKKILTPQEIVSRRNVAMERYIKTIEIESQIMLLMTRGDVIPSALRHQREAADSINCASHALAGLEMDECLLIQRQALSTVTSALAESIECARYLSDLRAELHKIEDPMKKAEFCSSRVIPAMERLRRPCDILEEIVDRREWNLPKYQDILFPE